MLVCSLLSTIRTRDRGCSAHPVFPAPSHFEGTEFSGKTRARCAARTRRHIRRHCEERSDEAIHSFFPPRDGLLRFARNDVDGYEFAFSRRIAPELCWKLPPSNQRAQGMPDARCTRDLACNVHKEVRTRAYRAAENTRHSLRKGADGHKKSTTINAVRVLCSNLCHKSLHSCGGKKYLCM